jgi:hypothetical protein
MKAHATELLAIAGCLVLVGCSTTNPNPPTPKANTGYVDFYTDSNLQLAWEIKCGDEKSGEMKTAYSEFDPLDGTTLRLASSPGNRKFQVWVMNRVTEGPEAVPVAVENGKVTPVHVTLTLAGTNSVRTKVYGFRGSAKGYGRGTKIESEDSEVYRIEATAEQPRAYQVKEQMPYFQTPPK